MKSDDNKSLTPERRDQLINEFRQINGMADLNDPLSHLQPRRKSYLVPEGKNEFDDDSAIILVMFLDYFLPEANGDVTQASMNHTAWIAGKMQIKDDALSAIAHKLNERRSHYKGRQLDDENAGYYEIVRSFIKSSPGKKTFSAFNNYWKSLPFSIKKKATPPFTDDTFVRWRNKILKEG